MNLYIKLPPPKDQLWRTKPESPHQDRMVATGHRIFSTATPSCCSIPKCLSPFVTCQGCAQHWSQPTLLVLNDLVHGKGGPSSLSADKQGFVYWFWHILIGCAFVSASEVLVWSLGGWACISDTYLLLLLPSHLTWAAFLHDTIHTAGAVVCGFECLKQSVPVSVGLRSPPFAHPTSYPVKVDCWRQLLHRIRFQ